MTLACVGGEVRDDDEPEHHLRVHLAMLDPLVNASATPATTDSPATQDRPSRAVDRSAVAAARRRSATWLACAGLASTCLSQAAPISDATVRGQAFLVEGEERGPLDRATFDFWRRADKLWTKQEVRVEDGLFELHVPPRTVWAMPGRIDVGGRAAWTTFGIEGDAPSEAPATMDVRWVKPATLRVVDASSLQDLANVEIVRLLYLEQGPPAEGSASARHVAKSAASPVELPFFENDPDSAFSNYGVVGVETYWVRAPGTAWSRIRVDPFHGGERLVKLSPATVLLQQNSLPRDLEWFVAPVGREQPAMRLPLFRDGSTAGLEAGSWALQLRRAEANGTQGEPLAETRFDLTRGSTRGFAHDELSALIRQAKSADVRDAPPNRAEVTVLLRVPSTWKPLAREIEIARVDGYGRARGRRQLVAASDAVRAPGDVELLRFELRDVECGPWRVSVDPLAWTESFEVTPDSPAIVRLDVGAPAAVRIRVLDGETHAPVQAEIRAASRPSSFHAVMERNRAMRKVDGEHALDVPAGSLRLIVHVDGRPDRYPELSVVPGPNELTLDSHEPIRVEIEARDGDARIPFDQLLATAESLDPSGEHAGISMADGLGGYYRMELGRPGRWRFFCHDVPGYSRPEPVEIDVRPGTSPRVVFRLAREITRR